MKVRAPQLNFARNIVYMEQLLGKPATRTDNFCIGLVGSSQINLGVDADQLAAGVDDCDVFKACLPGMVPLQYQAMATSIASQRPSVVVCWLSEFDFFREQELPTSRLRWCSDPGNMSRLTSVLSDTQKWSYRGDLADLYAASVLPVWQQRELFQMLAFRFWWRFDAEVVAATAEELQVGAVLANTEVGIRNLSRNIVRTPLLDANFAAFADFQQELENVGTPLVVFEGECHPEAMGAYPSEFRTETRQRLLTLSTELGFVYLPAEDRQQFDKTDWLDAVHLNDSGRQKLTAMVIDLLNHHTALSH